MTKPMQLNMAEITKLMRTGQLSEATQMIKSQMGSSAPAGLTPPSSLPSIPASGLGMLARMKGLPGLSSMSTQGLDALAGMKGLPGLQGLPGQVEGDMIVPEGAQWDWNTHQAAGCRASFVSTCRHPSKRGPSRPG